MGKRSLVQVCNRTLSFFLLPFSLQHETTTAAVPIVNEFLGAPLQPRYALLAYHQDDTYLPNNVVIGSIFATFGLLELQK